MKKCKKGKNKLVTFFQSFQKTKQKMTSRSEQLKQFNEKLASVKTETLSSNSLKTSYPDFQGMAQQQKQQLEQRRIEAEARGRAAVERSHVPKTSEEYRGAGSVPIRHPAKNEATHSSQLSVPIEQRQTPYYTQAIKDGKRLGKKTSDVCLVEVDARITGRGSTFAQENCKTFKGWQPGNF